MRSSIILFLVSLGLPPALAAENPPPSCGTNPPRKFIVQVSLDGGYTWLSDSATLYMQANRTVSIMARTLLTVTTGQTQGWSYSLEYDNSNQSYYGGSMSATSVSTSGTQTQTVQNGAPPDTNHLKIRTGFKGFTQGVAIDHDQFYNLAPTSNFVMAKACFSITSGSSYTTYPIHLKFTHEVGNPKIRTVISQLASAQVPCVQNFTLNVNVNGYQTTTGGCSITSGPMSFEGGEAGEIKEDGFDEGNTPEGLVSGCEIPFIRGDSNNDKEVDISDAIHILSFLFVAGSPVPGCLKGADSNADSGIDVSDGIRVLVFLFNGGMVPQPMPFCGIVAEESSSLSCITSYCSDLPVNANITNAMENKSEATVAINPKDEKNVVIVHNKWFDDGQMIERSQDGGHTWSTPSVITVGNPRFDPAMTYDDFGHLFLTFTSKQGLTLNVSNDNGSTFPVTISNLMTGTDRPDIATGPAPGESTKRSLWIVARADNSSVHALGAVIKDEPITSAGQLQFHSYKVTPEGCSGQTAFNNSTDFDCHVNYPSVAVGPSGEVMVAYNNGVHPENPTTCEVSVFAKLRPAVAINETNTGFALSHRQESKVCALIGSNGAIGWDFIPARPQAAKGIVPAPILTWNRVLNRVYMVYADKPTKDTPTFQDDDINVFLVFVDLDDDPPVWSQPIRVNDDASGVTSQFFARIDWDPISNLIAAIWYDTRGNPNLREVRLFAAIISDTGLGPIIAPNFPVSCGITDGDPTASGTGSTQQSTLGDYIGLDFRNRSFFAVWGDNSENPTSRQTDVFVKRIVVP